MYTAIIENITHASATVANLFTNFTPKNTIRPKKKVWFSQNENKKNQINLPMKQRSTVP